MSAQQVISAIIITAVLITASSIVLDGIPEPVKIVAKTGEFTLTHTAEYVYADDAGSPLFSVRVEGPMPPGRFEVFLRYRPIIEEQVNGAESFVQLQMPIGDQAIDDYEVYLSKLPIGYELLYYIEAIDSAGSQFAVLPENSGPRGELIPFEFRGIAPRWVEVSRFLFMAAALLSATLALFASMSIKKRPKLIRMVGKSTLWTTLFLIAGGIVFEVLYVREVFGGLGWNGWPVKDFDFAHTKFELVLFFWIDLTVLLKGSAFSYRPDGNLISPSTTRRLLPIAYVLLLTVYLIPDIV